MMMRYKALLIALLSFCVTASDARAETNGFTRLSRTFSTRIHPIYRAIAADPPGEAKSVVIEQDDGLVVVDATESPASGKHLVDRVKGISVKPVKFLIHAQNGQRGGTVLDDIRVGIDNAAKQIASTTRQLTRIELPRRLHTGWRRIVAAVIS